MKEHDFVNSTYVNPESPGDSITKAKGERKLVGLALLAIAVIGLSLFSIVGAVYHGAIVEVRYKVSHVLPDGKVREYFTDRVYYHAGFARFTEVVTTGKEVSISGSVIVTEYESVNAGN